jgi:effector-binding domain-containing protein
MGHVRVRVYQRGPVGVADPRLHVPDLLADGVGPSRAALALLLAHEGVARIREAQDRVLAAVSPGGRRRLELALALDDVGAAMALCARESREPELFDGEFASLPEPPLSEADALLLLDVVGVGPVSVTGLEAALLGSSPHREPFLRSLRAWLRVMGRQSAEVDVLVWAGAMGALVAWDPGLKMGVCADDRPPPHGEREVRRALAETLGLRPVSRHVYKGDATGAVILAWPPGRVPASAVAALVADGLKAVRGMPVAALVPDWALGTRYAPARAGLVAAFPNLRFFSLDVESCVALASKRPSLLVTQLRIHLADDAPVEIQVRCEQPALVVGIRCAPAELGLHLSTAFAQVGRAIVSAGGHVVGPPFARYLDLEDGHFVVEAGIPTGTAQAGEGDVVPVTLPGGAVATTMHVGPYERLGLAHERLRAAVIEAGREPAGPPWESYVMDPASEPDSDKWRTLLQLPIAP